MYAERFFWLHSKIEGAEQTQKQALDKVAEFKNVKPETLYKLPHLPANLSYVFGYFFEILEMGEIDFKQIESWQNLKQFKLTPFELLAIAKIKSKFNG